MYAENKEITEFTVTIPKYSVYSYMNTKKALLLIYQH